MSKMILRSLSMLSVDPCVCCRTTFNILCVLSVVALFAVPFINIQYEIARQPIKNFEGTQNCFAGLDMAL